MPALYDVTVGHRRSQVLDDAFTHRMVLWLVDLDDLPSFPGIAFRGADHLGHPDRPIRENLDAFLAAEGRPRPARVLMLAHPRTLGYVFNPITLYWCHDADGALTAVVAEVHNTYGGRHHYLLDVDDAGRARVDKDFYVSPFFPVDGEYRMRVPEPAETLAATVVLRRPDEAGVLTTAFVATMRGRRRPATRAAVVRALLRHPLVTQRVSLAIRRRGIRLWARGLPVIARTPADVDPGLGQLAARGAESRV
ncbi:DUF1365 domain-containing protein [Actinomycetospora sp. TBRC 11914]|uniref:DUF1365 domain-containing protein n=1 Tax=Actinomycetospora sp. TBRC 11914 TaxID=2729387 RepID=UPI00145D953D|nr:DUF1365 domain-containing protein [Actinomycetospora sp. TBRC 11914]NMO89821.1 DUF1365 domain-containing protein [Actinomycetospora sp. TBRC 11914]